MCGRFAREALLTQHRYASRCPERATDVLRPAVVEICCIRRVVYDMIGRIGVPMHTYVLQIWSALGVYWLLSAGRVKRAARSQSSPSRYATLLGLAVGFILLFSSSVRVSVLAERVAVDSPLVESTG